MLSHCISLATMSMLVVGMPMMPAYISGCRIRHEEHVHAVIGRHCLNAKNICICNLRLFRSCAAHSMMHHHLVQFPACMVCRLVHGCSVGQDCAAGAKALQAAGAGSLCCCRSGCRHQWPWSARRCSLHCRGCHGGGHMTAKNTMLQMLVLHAIPRPLSPVELSCDVDGMVLFHSWMVI